MKVLYLINYAGKAGTEKYVENLVHILSPDHIEPFFAYGVGGELSEKMAAAGVPSIKLDMGRSAVPRAAKKLAAYCRENDIDVIHAQYPRENMIALISKRYFDKPKVVMTNHLTLRLHGPSGMIWRALNRHFTPKDHCIIAVCREGRDIMIENGVPQDRIKVIYNGIEPAGKPEKDVAIREELGIAPDCFVITIFARFAPEKGLDFLLDVLGRLGQTAPSPFCCLVCGDGELFGQISEKADAMGLGDRCRLLGYRSDTARILRCSDIYVCTSSRNEAMSFAILEAMNAGLPLVVTDVGGNRDLAETGLQCGFVVPYGDTEGFAGSIEKLMSDRDLLADYSDTAIRKIAEDFDLHKLAEDVYNTYL